MMAMGKPKAEGEIPEEVVEEATEEGETPLVEAAEQSGYSVPAPEGYAPPEGSEDGKDFDEIVKLRLGPDGALKIVKIGSFDVGDKAPEQEEELEQVDGTAQEAEPDAGKALGMAIQTQRGR